MEHEGFPLFAKEGKLYSYVAKGKFLDIGTFSSLLLAHKILPGRKKERKGAIFLDRDGVINKQKEGYVLHPEDFEFELGAIDGMKKMARLGMPLIIVTNQSVIGRGLSTLAILKKIHGKMLSGLRKHGIRIDSIFFCPHKPDESCGCRKPKIGMLVAAQEKHNLDLSKSFVIGDSTSDILMGKAAGCTTILVRTGYGGKDKLHKVKPDYICKDLPDAASIIARIVKRSKFGFS
jgi:histidinol-phosphate phosphatase family protein